MKGFIVYSDYAVIDNNTIVELYGRLENGHSFVALAKIKPYFFIEENDLKRVSKYLSKYKVEKTSLTTFKGKKVVKILSNIQTDLNKLNKTIHSKTSTYEADIKPNYRFMYDNDLLGTINIEGEYETSEKVDRVYKNPIIKPAEFKPELKIVSLDIEADSAGKLICIGLYSENYKENFMITNQKLKDTIACKDEIECIERFKHALIKLDPDIITGWNVINFDLKYIQELCRKHKLPFDIGRNNFNIRLRIESDFFRSSSADIPGRQVLDGLNLIKDPFIKEAPAIKQTEFKSYALEDVAQSILNDGKLIKGKHRHDQIDLLYKTDAQKISDYNLQDCKLAYEILEKTKVIDLAIERSQLTGMPLDRLTASIASFDSLYIREARKKGLVSPSMVFGEKEERIKGGYVMESEPGVYSNVIILDFKSLYPSVIRTFNIDPASFLDKKKKDAIESPNKAYFKNQEGILPEIIEKLHKAREKAKREKRELASYAIKTIMNSFFGVLATPNCRFFNLQMANAITHFGQFLIKLTAKKIEEKDYGKVIYSDTDSIFLETKLEKEKANALGKEIQDYINSFYQEYIQKEYKRKSFLELQFEKQYISLMIPKIRGEATLVGAKKRYAGLIEKDGKEKIEIRGLEAIRGDWTEAAKEFQRELLKKLFHKEPIEQFIKFYITQIKEGKFDDKLVYKKSIRKSLQEYTKTTPPHVKAARQLEVLHSNIIYYYITTAGPEPVQKLVHKIDYSHYIEKQIKPIANQILNLLNKNFDEVVKNSKQTTLF